MREVVRMMTKRPGTVSRRGSFLLALVLLTASPVPAVSDVVVIKSKDILPYDEAVDGFTQVCTSEVIAYTLGDAESSESEILRNVTKSRTKLILAVGSPALQFAVNKFSNIPVVFSVVVDPSGVVGDVTSVRGATLQVAPRTQFEALLQIAPHVKRLGVVHDPAKTGHLVEAAAKDARGLGLELISREVGSTADVAAAWKEIQDGIDAIWMVPDTTALTDQSFQYMLTISSKRNLPLLAISGKYVSKGALLALTADYRDVGRQAGEIANSVLRGADPGRIRSTTARSPKLVLNLRTAELIGLSVPKEVTEKAAHVYN